MDKKYIKYIILAAVLIIGVFLYLFFTMNPARRETLQNSLQNLFPFGEPQDTTTITGTTPDGEVITIDPETGEVITQEAPQVRQITDFAVAGYQPITTEVSEQITRTIMQDDGTEVETTETVRRNIHTVRYARSSNSYLFDTVVDSGLATQQLTDGFIPNSEEAIFSADLNSVVLRSFNDEQRVIRTYFGSIDKIPVVPDACPFAFPVNLKFQDTSEEVTNIQRFLNGFLGFTISETGENSPGNETGIYDELTRQAILQFQASRSIAADGNVGPKTREQLLAACMEVQTKKAEELFRINNPYAYRLQGSFGQENIIELSDTVGSFTTFIRKQANTAITYVRNLTTRTTAQVYDSPFSEWLLQPISQNRIFLTSKASQTVPGYLYELNTANQTFKKIIGNVNGLTTLVSPNGNQVLYSASTDTGFTLNLYNTATQTGSTLGIATLPEKCTWNATSTMIYCAIPDALPSATYPDNWYQGLVRFNDSIWSIDAVTGATNRLIELAEYKNSGINAIDLKTTAGDRYLYFRDKNDDTLWVADLFQ